MGDDITFNIYFTGNTFMGIYDMGAAQSIVDHAKRTLQKVKGYAGTSAGAIVACILLTTPDKVLVRKHLICYFVCCVRPAQVKLTSGGVLCITNKQSRLMVRSNSTVYHGYEILVNHIRLRSCYKQFVYILQ